MTPKIDLSDLIGASLQSARREIEQHYRSGYGADETAYLADAILSLIEAVKLISIAKINNTDQAQKALESASPEFLAVLDEISALFDNARQLSGYADDEMLCILSAYFGRGKTDE